MAGLLLGSRDIYGGMNYVQELNHMDDAGEMGKLLEKEKSVLPVQKLQVKPWVLSVWVPLVQLLPI